MNTNDFGIVNIDLCFNISLHYDKKKLIHLIKLYKLGKFLGLFSCLC